MLIQKGFKASIITLLALIIVSLSGLYIYSLSQRERLKTPEKVYRDTTEAEMAIVKEHIKSMKRHQQEQQDRQQVAAQKPEYTADSETLPQIDTKVEVSENIVKPPIDISQTMDVPNIEELIENGSVDNEKLPEIKELMGMDVIPPNLPGITEVTTSGGTTFHANSPQELQSLISQLENSDNPNHRAIATALKNSNTPTGARVSITIVE